MEWGNVLKPVLTNQTIALLVAFDAAWNEHVRLSCERTLQLLRESPAPFDRHNFSPGHITASAIVLAPDQRSVLLVHHRRLDRWLQPGGHIEVEDADLCAAAAREVREETGIEVRVDVAPALAGVSVHRIPTSAKEPEHWHHDLLFSMAATTIDLQVSHESRDVIWCPLDSLSEYGLDSHLVEIICRSTVQR
jgi:8-oxo-dGTP pyrophosphatase MutT (NUDIX family)